jgi:hypothetical protein
MLAHWTDAIQRSFTVPSLALSAWVAAHIRISVAMTAMLAHWTDAIRLAAAHIRISVAMTAMLAHWTDAIRLAAAHIRLSVAATTILARTILVIQQPGACLQKMAHAETRVAHLGSSRTARVNGQSVPQHWLEMSSQFPVA